MVGIELVIKRLHGEQLVPAAEVPEHEVDRAQAIQFDGDGVERGESGVVDLERLGVHLGDGDEGANHLHVPLRRGGMLSAGLEVISSKPDPLIEHGKLVEGHVGTRSERDGIVGRQSGILRSLRRLWRWGEDQLIFNKERFGTGLPGGKGNGIRECLAVNFATFSSLIAKERAFCSKIRIIQS